MQTDQHAEAQLRCGLHGKPYGYQVSGHHRIVILVLLRAFYAAEAAHEQQGQEVWWMLEPGQHVEQPPAAIAAPATSAKQPWPGRQQVGQHKGRAQQWLLGAMKGVHCVTATLSLTIAMGDP
jgi:hypothetical protein